MVIFLKSSLHTEDLPSTPSFGDLGTTSPLLGESEGASTQVVYVLTGGTENQFVEKVEAGKIDLTKPVYLVASGQSNSLAASLEILAYINQHGGKGEVIC